FSVHPCLPFCQSHYKQQGPFAPRTLLRFLATTDPAESLSSSTDFPVSPVIRFPCSADFATGRGGFLQLLSMTLSPCCPYQPRRSVTPHQSTATLHAAFARKVRAPPSGFRTFEAISGFTLALRPGDSLTTLIRWLCQ